MVAALLYYKKFVKSLTKKRFKLNPYNGCIANKTVNGKQITKSFSVLEMESFSVSEMESFGVLERIVLVSWKRNSVSV